MNKVVSNPIFSQLALGGLEEANKENIFELREVSPGEASRMFKAKSLKEVLTKEIRVLNQKCEKLDEKKKKLYTEAKWIQVAALITFLASVPIGFFSAWGYGMGKDGVSFIVLGSMISVCVLSVFIFSKGESVKDKSISYINETIKNRRNERIFAEYIKYGPDKDIGDHTNEEILEMVKEYMRREAENERQKADIERRQKSMETLQKQVEAEKKRLEEAKQKAEQAEKEKLAAIAPLQDREDSNVDSAVKE